MGKSFSKFVSQVRRKENQASEILPESLNSFKTSKSSQLPEGFNWLDGRGFKPGMSASYPLPGDELEIYRLNVLHYNIRYVCVGLGLDMAGRGDDEYIFDGCGTGIWCIDLATTYPKSTFTGTDITDVFRDNVVKAPSNVHFKVNDTRKGLPFKDGEFDFVYERFQCACYKVAEWPDIIKELARRDAIETPGTVLNSGPNATMIMNDKLDKMMKLRGIDMHYIYKLKEPLEAAGIVNLQIGYRSMPIGWGPEELQKPTITSFMTSLRALRPQMTVSLGLSDEEYDEMVDNVEDVELKTHKTFINFTYYCGRKPVAVTTEG
ncbi:hypothetical protein BC937DRAFT_91080 [Endogone sp. FLAS-F59071]|nr:hypothetical protein BC937DRAFT_91080 [Endogone sp. FLAS-F59071]|eukprot:RUS16556.1 hypothetical protein BC937DRAFT_91080 [Endogone sp. FLAS-F59071]